LGTLNVTEMQNNFCEKTFNFLFVKDVVPFKEKTWRLLCVCKCGNETLATPRQLKTREKVSCGCWKKAVLGIRSTTHGQANSRITGYKNRTYGIWQAMRDRCSNNKRKDYYRYGGRGITVCKRWEKYENFLEDMGEAPQGLTLDRINNDKNYSPSNCRWATKHQQSYNSTRVLWVTHEGKTKSLSGWCEFLKLSKGTYYSRRNRGWTLKEALGLQQRRSK